MAKRMILFVVTVLLITAAWSAMDWYIHGKLLAEEYEATSALWRPMEEMNAYMKWMSAITLATATFFSLIFYALVREGASARGWHMGCCSAWRRGFRWRTDRTRSCRSL